MREVLVKGGHGGRITVGAGERLEIVNVDGSQICDFFAFSADDVKETLSPAHCRAYLRRVVPRAGDRLVSVRWRPMFEVIADSVGVHDMSFPACDPVRYSRDFGLHDHRNCRTNLAEVMTDHGIPYLHLPDPINFFQMTPIDGDGVIGYGGVSPAKAGDRIVLRALMDSIAVVSACPQDITGVNGDRLTDIRLVVRPPE